MTKSAAGVALYAGSDLGIPGYWLLIALAILLPGSKIGGMQLPLEGMSALAAAVAYLACFAVFDGPSRARADLRHALIPRG